MTTVPFHALFAEDNINPNESMPDHPGKLVDAADVVFAQDVMTGHQALVYGRAVMKRIAAGEEIDVEVLAVALDMETDELERVIALVQILKGHHDYHPVR